MIARLSRPVSVRRLTSEETVTLEATDEERESLAEALELVELKSLTADLTVRPWRGEGVRVSGTVRGEVVQSCVVTLDPVPGTVEEAFDVRLHPDVVDPETIEVDPDAPDPPEHLATETVDVGAIALEHFVLGLDPYPRVPGAEFDAPGDEAEEEDEPSPFAALAALKNGKH